MYICKIEQFCNKISNFYSSYWISKMFWKLNVWIWHLAISCSLMSLLQNTINKKCLQFSINSDQIYQRKSSTDFLTVSNILENLITVTVPSAAIHQALNTTECFVCFTTKWYQFKLLLQEFLCNFRWYLYKYFLIYLFLLEILKFQVKLFNGNN
jgi:hypothetical protein